MSEPRDLRAAELARLPNGHLLVPLVPSRVLIGAGPSLGMLYAGLLWDHLRMLQSLVGGGRRN